MRPDYLYTNILFENTTYMHVAQHVHEVAKYALQQQTQLHHTVIWFTMVQFMGHLITVGGGIEDEMHEVIGNVYCFKEQSQKWEEFL